MICLQKLNLFINKQLLIQKLQQSFKTFQKMERSKDKIILFDVDGTLTKPRNIVEQDMIDTLAELKKKHYVAVVGGSDLHKIIEQLTKPVVDSFDYCFSENGTYSLKEGQFFAKRSIGDEIGEDKLKKFINTTLRLLSEIDIPVKRGTFIEYRNGMINISPIGRNCSQQERDEFEKFDLQHNIRKNLISKLESEFPDLNLKYSIGGQISFDVFPIGWDKTYCLRFLEEFKEIHFYGDKTFPGGNDYEIYTSERTVGHSVKNFQETIASIKENFLN
ncbi:phosphomannomutase (macronuclear) [Tetrahymena thermophila SB210]|uniref:Phosphomannomutase n=1 Tax=Tetrahymena thermophila (strain SB210) TaxID=312017 RepID=I7MDE4_TETTS|nr:phosphomannomutase [Tetrahymena thermophila SB210]EAR87425.2 phosphomannomutase [Tetrahymena thermophila SB210]|eukprot:XP_001007670.2 phosphomannomutase [Tetrahymena thermophila SB210]